MSTLQEILNLNIVENISTYVQISDRFKDENGNILKFKIRPILFNELNNLKKKATFFDKNGKADIDEGMLNMYCITEATIEPNFKDANSIEKLGVFTPEQYINKVLLAGEIDKLINEILKISGFLIGIEEMVADIKN